MHLTEGVLSQALFFSRRGITPLGANTFTLGVVGPAFALAAWRVSRRPGSPRRHL